jgi:hypothetical protein
MTKIGKISIKIISSSKTASKFIGQKMDVEEIPQRNNKCCSHSGFDQFDGNHTICCNGKLILGPHYSTFLVSHFMIIVPSILYFIFA